MHVLDNAGLFTTDSTVCLSVIAAALERQARIVRVGSIGCGVGVQRLPTAVPPIEDSLRSPAAEKSDQHTRSTG